MDTASGTKSNRTRILNVGVLLPLSGRRFRSRVIPTVDRVYGGVYAFSETVLTTLGSDEIQNGLKNNYVLVGFRKELSRFKTQRKLDLGAPIGFFYKMFIRVIIEFIFNTLRLKFLGINFTSIEVETISKVLRSANIDVLYSPAPLLTPVSVPYAQTLMDLGHITNPWFREIAISSKAWVDRDICYDLTLSKAIFSISGTSIGIGDATRRYGIEKSRFTKIPFPVTSSEIEENSGTRFEATRVNKKLNLDQPFFIYPAQFWAHKNHITLIEAFESLLSFDSQVNLILTGSTLNRAESILDRVKASGLQENIFILEFIERSSLVQLYKKALALIYPSLLGPDNLPPLEAMHHGCLALVSDLPGHREQFGNAVLYFDPLSTNSMYSVMRKVLKLGDERSRISRLGFELARERTPEKYVTSIDKEMQNRSRLINVINS